MHSGDSAVLVTDVPIDSIRPYDANPRRNEGAVAAVAASIGEFGFRQARWEKFTGKVATRV